MNKWHAFTGRATSALTGYAAPARANVVTEWSALAVQCINRAGPTALLDIALVHAAMHDSIQAIEGDYAPYVATPPANGTESSSSAAAAAAYTVLSHNDSAKNICPDSFQPSLDAAFAPYFAGQDPGLGVGYAAAARLLSEWRPAPVITFNGSTDIGQWRPTPPANLPMQFVYLATTTPFTLNRPSQFRPAPPPPMQSQVYTREYNEVKDIGSIASHASAPACPGVDSTDKARFWSGNFVAQWNQVARDLAVTQQLSLGDSARLLALVNLAMADALIAVWDSKLFYHFWRPITAIQLGNSDPNARTAGDPNWLPFIQSTSHFPLTPPSQNPAYPDYVSGANGLTGAATAMLQFFFGTDAMSFAVNKATAAAVMICTNPRTYTRFSDAAQEVVDARILLGIHFRSADEEARRLGTRVAHWTFMKTLRPQH
jgi:hypothetical protein